MQVIKLGSQEEFENLKNDKNVVFKFGATWCAPCKILDHDFENKDILKKYPGVTLVKVDVDEFPEIADMFKVSTIPRVITADKTRFIEGRKWNVIDDILSCVSKISQEEEKAMRH